MYRRCGFLYHGWGVYCQPAIAQAARISIQSAAAELLRFLWLRTPPPSTGLQDTLKFLRDAPKLAMAEFGYAISQPTGIMYQDEEIGTSSDDHAEVLALVDPASKLVVIAGNRPLVERRFTLAHEVAHISLNHFANENAVLRRSKELSGRVIRHNAVEAEAELFAANFLMPEKVIRRLFSSLIGDPIANASHDPVFSLIANFNKDGRNVRKATLLAAATLIANATYAGRGGRFASMASQLQVSPDALARRLIELTLVQSQSVIEASSPVTEHTKAKLFIGSSVEGLECARAIQQELEHDCEPAIWNQNIFTLTQSTIADLRRNRTGADFAVFALTPDDALHLRGRDLVIARDNVIFELGMALMELGTKRVFFVTPRGVQNFHLPSDMNGIQPGSYAANRGDRNLRAALGPFCTEVRQAIRTCGVSRKNIR